MQTLIDLLLRHGVLLVFVVTLAARVGAPLPAAPMLVVAGAGTAAAAALVALLAAVVALRWWRRHRLLGVVGMPRIGVAELRSRLQEANPPPLLIDVRSRTSLDIDPRRLPGARHVELGDLARVAAEVPPEREVVVYCNCPNDVSAARAALILRARGFGNVRPLAGGLEAWFEDA